MENSNLIYKIVILGDSGVGKTSILSKYSRDEFNMDTKSTVGVEIATRNILVDNVSITAQIWDTAGQERYRAITKVYYRGVRGALLVYDITQKSSFESIENWLKDLKEGNNTPQEELVIMIIGNKSDLNSAREVTTSEAKKFAENKGLFFFETSASDSSNVQEAFQKIVSEIYLQSIQSKNKLKNKKKEEIVDNDSKPVVLEEKKVVVPKATCC
eukprot:TRINITY_DN1587_c0_g1_i4.p1 TRINITY_DN1587_c0_g1~~TRINITY_DN1587_c0_g1_i4.p1  ORF type:complete len:214 (+),score=52.51 TRINITY_DN1587_c0_g1_i4:20-661(+)